MNNNERREYFRIEDFIDVAFTVSPDQHPAPKLSVVTKSGLNDYQASNDEFNTIVNSIWSGQPKVAKALGLLNRKIDLIASEMNLFSELSQHEHYDFHFINIRVNLSGCGMAFDCDSSFEKADQLDLLLTLKPSNTKIQATGIVVDAMKNNKDKAKPYRIRLELQLEKLEEELLIQHIVQRQMQLINEIEDKEEEERLERVSAR